MTVWLGHSCPSIVVSRNLRTRSAGRTRLSGPQAGLEGRPYTIAGEKDECAGEGARATLLLNRFGLSVVLYRSGFLIFLINVLIGDGAGCAFAGLCRC